MSTAHINSSLAGDGFFLLLNIFLLCNMMMVVFSKLCISKQESLYIEFPLTSILVGMSHLFVMNFELFFAKIICNFDEETSYDNKIWTNAYENRTDNLIDQTGNSKNATSYIDNETNDDKSMSGNNDNLSSHNGRTMGDKNATNDEKQYQESDESTELFLHTESFSKTGVYESEETREAVSVVLSKTEERLQESSHMYNHVPTAYDKRRLLCEKCHIMNCEMKSEVKFSGKSDQEVFPVEEVYGKCLLTETTEIHGLTENKALSSKLPSIGPFKEMNLYAYLKTPNLRCFVYKDLPTPTAMSLYQYNKLCKHNKIEPRNNIAANDHVHAIHNVLNDFKTETKLLERMSVEQEVKQIINHVGCTCAHSPRELFLLPLMRGEEVDDPVEQLKRIIDKTVRGEPVPAQESMRFELLRICTYRTFPKDGKPDVRKYAEAGFYYASNSDEVICYCCYKRISNWKADDDPIAVHRNISPTCRFHIDNSTVNVAKDVTAHVETEIMAQI
ncbi:hypothetical protein DPMN_131763 [Dreissena polymorpha]|uniref:Uncharacterized protein n=1 Tax=Dreissena polymorpha TaxID=45954 RepID=A0A9D4FUX2_DREPO|nr:hypothetical protein DPMN_131763 [Dreissena polymorpha]